MIETPGPATSGFGPAGTLSRRGPRDENDATTSAPGKSATVTPWARTALSRFPSARETMTEGIVIVASVPPIGIAGPSTLFASTAAIAPASCARFTFSTNVHPPRSTSAIFPRIAEAFAIVAQASSGEADTSGPIVPSTGATPPKSGAPPPTTPATDSGARTRSVDEGTPGSPEAATERAWSETPGLPETK